MNIIGNGFTVNYVNGIPNVVGVINVSTTFRGGPGTGKLNGQGVPIRMTPNGYCYDECISALQKSIRRGLLTESLFWACEIYDMNGPFRSNLINRIKVIVSEDIGIANSFAVVAVDDYLRRYKRSDDEERKKRIIMGIVKMLCLSPKNRWCDSIIHATMEPDPSNFPVGFGKWDFSDWNGKLFHPKTGDGKKLVRFMNNFKRSLDTLDETAACYWVQKIFDIHPDERNSALRNTSRGKSRDPMYAVWEELFRRNPAILGFRGDDLIVKCLLKFYDEKKNGRTERLFVVHAILEYCRRRRLRTNRWDLSDCYERMILTDVEWNSVEEHVKIPMPDWAIDKHTIRGKRRGRDTNHFWNVGALLMNVHPALPNDPYFDRARALNVARDKKGMSPPRRQKTKKKKKKVVVKKVIRDNDITGKKRKRNCNDEEEELVKKKRKL
jgi:hypothetical protein